MDGLKPGRIVYVVDGVGVQHPAMVTHVYADGTTIDASAIVRRSSSLLMLNSIAHDPSAAICNSWTWMYDGQASRGNAK